MSSLEDIIDLPAHREAKRALAVKMILFDFKTEDICALLTVSDSFVSKWKIKYENEGASALKLNYKGGTGLLTEDPRDEIIFRLEISLMIAWKNSEIISSVTMEWSIIRSHRMMTSGRRETELASDPSG